MADYREGAHTITDYAFDGFTHAIYGCTWASCGSGIRDCPYGYKQGDYLPQARSIHLQFAFGYHNRNIVA
jgi:hypothetical protein